jgi:hypothetical protein
MTRLGHNDGNLIIVANVSVGLWNFFYPEESKNSNSGFIVASTSYAPVPLCQQSHENLVLNLQICCHGGQF